MPPQPTTTRRTRSARSVLLGSVLVVTTGWSLASGTYIALHDRFLATLIGRQAEMQYAYEDRIAALQEAVGAAAARSDRGTDAEAARWHDLDARSAKLEARAAQLEQLLAAGTTTGAPPPSGPDGLRRAEGGFVSPETRLARLEARQQEAIRLASERTHQASDRLQAALAELGLAAPVADTAAAGGPFVPLPLEATTIDGDFDGLQAEQLRRARFETAAARLPLRQPVEGRLDVTSGYGARRDPFLGRLALHTGIDLREQYGSPVLAAAGGTVTVAGPETGYGTTVEVDHGNGYATRYAHLSSALVAVGQRVDAGAVVGRVGTTGRSTGPHLHYEVRIANEPIDPARYLALAARIAGR